ncbi:Divalent cation transporter [Kalmanozyma brasiliensis GHG001]|uniref:SLC41A/MgtE integral membrane domain-containing protein n=1 Tax=Kalmanozyma brasiliensis (strain GHG001) TaxID=1365824 RepID=V5EWA5_KALBG|nr:Divalent cation transporter [Kalmanozyma brasiliensis GHG001]EST09845.1 Divalent cation transporter [Kalmanozyma brasiliensis GHG001]
MVDPASSSKHNTISINDNTTAVSAHPGSASAPNNLLDRDSEAQAPHHTISGDSDSDVDDDSVTNAGSFTDQRSDIKSIDAQSIRVTDYTDGEARNDNDTVMVQAGGSGYSDADLKQTRDLESSQPPSQPRGTAHAADEDLDDEYETHASLLGTAGFVDRRGTASRLAARSAFSRFWEIAREALPTLIVSVLSLMFSGELLVHLARWPVFRKVDKLFILIPILLNMKGNLEMNLSLRMSTSANIGELDVRRTRETLIRGNLALLQVQALIVSMFAGVLAFVLGVVTPDPQVEAPVSPVPTTPRQQTPENALISSIVRSAFSAVTLRNRRRSLAGTATTQGGSWLQKRRIIHHPKPPTDPALRLRNGYFEFVLVIATAMLSASLSSAMLGSFMCALVVIARRAGANPDNIASPLAASLGDLTTLTILGLLASSLVHFEGTFLATVILAAMAVACIASFIVTYRNAYVRELLTSGWVPLLMAMFISSGAGLVLDEYVGKYEGFALLAPVISGLPGACAAIFASRITTSLHSGKGAALLRAASKAGDVGGIRGTLASIRSVLLIPPIEGWLVPISLFTMGVGIKVVFIVMIRVAGQMSFGWIFALTFIGASVAANLFALYLAHVICLVLWSRDYDPDIYCLPFVSSIVDVVGQSLLVMTFGVATGLGDHITAAVNAGHGAV